MEELESLPIIVASVVITPASIIVAASVVVAAASIIITPIVTSAILVSPVTTHTFSSETEKTLKSKPFSEFGPVSRQWLSTFAPAHHLTRIFFVLAFSGRGFSLLDRSRQRQALKWRKSWFSLWNRARFWTKKTNKVFLDQIDELSLDSGLLTPTH